MRAICAHAPGNIANNVPLEQQFTRWPGQQITRLFLFRPAFCTVNAAPETDRRYRPTLPLLTAALWLGNLLGGKALPGFSVYRCRERAFQRAGSSVFCAGPHPKALGVPERMQTLATALAPMLGNAANQNLQQMHDLPLVRRS